MSIFAKLWTAVKGGAHETAEAIADHQAIRILDQEIRDADIALGQALDEQAKMMAKRKLKEEDIHSLNQDIEKYTSAAQKALAKGNETLAIETAERIAELQQKLTVENGVLNEYASAESSITAAIQGTKTKIETLRREVETVKATEAVQAAQASVAARHSGVNSALGSAANSLDRIKQKQRERDARISAAEEMANTASGSDLDQKLAAAGISQSSKPSAQAILESLKQVQQP